MGISKDDILAFVPKLEASRSNLVDEVLWESRVQSDKEPNDKDGTILNKYIAELAALQIAIAAMKEVAEERET